MMTQLQSDNEVAGLLAPDESQVLRTTGRSTKKFGLNLFHKSYRDTGLIMETETILPQMIEFTLHRELTLTSTASKVPKPTSAMNSNDIVSLLIKNRLHQICLLIIQRLATTNTYERAVSPAPQEDMKKCYKLVESLISKVFFIEPSIEVYLSFLISVCINFIGRRWHTKILTLNWRLAI